MRLSYLVVVTTAVLVGCQQPSPKADPAPPSKSASAPETGASAAAARPKSALRSMQPMGTMGPVIRVPTTPVDDWTNADGTRGALVTSADRKMQIEVLQGQGYWSVKSDDDGFPKSPDVALKMAVATEPNAMGTSTWKQRVRGKEQMIDLHFASFEVDRDGSKRRVIVKSWIFDNDNAFVWIELPASEWSALRSSVALVMSVDALDGPK